METKANTQAKRAHAKASLNLLRDAGIQCTSRNNGWHIIIPAIPASGKPRIDFWPSTGKYMINNTGQPIEGDAYTIINKYWDMGERGIPENPNKGNVVRRAMRLFMRLTGFGNI